MNPFCSIADCDNSATLKTFCKELLKLRIALVYSVFYITNIIHCVLL